MVARLSVIDYKGVDAAITVAGIGFVKVLPEPLTTLMKSITNGHHVRACPARRGQDRWTVTTIADVARRAGVSTATVSRALSGREPVSEAVRERVVEAAASLGYRPNAIARSLRMEATQTLGLVISDVCNPFFTELARAVEDEAHAHGYSLILGNADEDPRRQSEYVGLLLDKRVDGLLLTPAVGTAKLVGEAAKRGTPIVFVDRAIDGYDIPVVRAEGSTATTELVDHLVALGHRRIALIAGPQEALPGRERLTAFRAALAAHHIAVPPEYLQVGDFQQASGERAAAVLLDLPEPPTAIFAADNLMTLGALKVFHQRGLAMPDDIALASFDDAPWFELMRPPITAIVQPTTQIAAAAVGALVDLVAGRPARSTTMPCRLITRASCGEPATTEGNRT